MPTPRPRVSPSRLTAVRVKTAGPGRHGDGGGLYLEVDTSGARRWILRTVVQGKRCDLGLGSAKLVSLATARDDAADLRRIARAGGDPRTARRGAPHIPSFREAASQLHATHAATFRNARHRATWLSSLVLDVFPTIGDRPVDTITSSDMLAILTPIWLKKPETARRVKQRMKAVLEWATAAGHRSPELANPVDGVVRVLPRHKGDKQHHPALPYTDVAAFLRQVRASEAGTSTKLALELLVLTASRTNEILGARWDEVDRAAQVWTVPAARMKAGRPHRVPLAAPCLALFDQAAAVGGNSPYSFQAETHSARCRTWRS